jgi:hypothetical protein
VLDGHAPDRRQGSTLGVSNGSSRQWALNPNELRLQLDLVHRLLLADGPEKALAIVSGLPPADPVLDVYLAQDHIQLGQSDHAREAVLEGLSRFSEDARLMRQARELEIGPATNP